MTGKLGIVALVALLAAGTAHAGIGNGQGVDSGNKNGWTNNQLGPDGDNPKGLEKSGENGRVDNGKGNGGERPGGATPNKHGEDGKHDADPN